MPEPVDITRGTEVSGGWPTCPRIACRNEAPGLKETLSRALARRLYRDAAFRRAPGARRRRSTERVSTPVPGGGICDGPGLRWRLCRDRTGFAWTSRTPLLLLLLTRLFRQFSLLSGVVVIWLGHDPSGCEAVELRPMRCNRTRITAGLRAARRYRNVFESYYVDRRSDSCDNGYVLV